MSRSQTFLTSQILQSRLSQTTHYLKTTVINSNLSVARHKTYSSNLNPATMKITTIHSPWMNSLMLHPNLMIQLLIPMMSTTECLNTSIMMICSLYSTFLITLTFYMWSRYPKVKGIFGVTLPSSAPVERFFSTVGHIEVLRRNCFSDSTFEQLLLLKALLSS